MVSDLRKRPHLYKFFCVNQKRIFSLIRLCTSGGSRVSIWGGGANLKLAGDFHGERGSASLYGGLGALPPVGSRGKAPGQGGFAP
jgi:hypothetical protein